MLIKKCFTCILAFLLLLIPCWHVHAEGIGSLSSLSTVLYEPQSGRTLYKKDAHKPRPMASTTKIMTALIAAEQCPPDRIITVKAAAVRVEGSSIGLRAGDQITMLDLITGLLLESGNDAANAIAYAIAGDIPSFAALMNQRADELQMKNTTFVTPSGLDAKEHLSTAYDMALLAAEALKNETIASICSRKRAVIRFGNPPRDVTVSNHNRLLQLYPYAIGMKTGFTKKSGRCLVSAAEKDGIQLIAVTLKAGNDWKDHIALYQYGFSKTELSQLPLPDLPKVSISGGLVQHTALTMDSPPACVLLNGDKDKIQIVFDLPRFVLAPIKAGDQLGTVRYMLDGQELCCVSIKAAEDVQQRPITGFWKRFSRFIKLLLIDILD